MKDRIARNIPLLIGIILVVILMIIPTGYEDAVIYQGTDRCSALVLETDESRLIDSGLIRSGEQAEQEWVHAIAHYNTGIHILCS